MVNLNFRGKSEVYSYHLAVPHHDLSNVDKSKSVGKADGEGNLIIQGDNLLALKSLLPKYEGRVKCIYIDPPYNTGNEKWVYNDNVNSEMLQSWLGKVVDKEDQTRHDKWLCMMWPRLQLLRRLLADDGVIFISIDDNEVHHLRAIMDEIFEEDNFIGEVVRICKTASDKGSFFAPSKDYILTYSFDKNCTRNFTDAVNKSLYKKQNENGFYRDDIALYQSSLDPLRGSKNQRYYIECPDGSLAIPPGKNFPNSKTDSSYIEPKNAEDKVWRWSYSSYNLQKDKLVFKKTKNSPLLNEKGVRSDYNIYTKSYYNERLEKGTTPRDFVDSFYNRKGKDLLKKIDISFDYSKPKDLIFWLLKIINQDKNMIVLDSFSGSGTTAHAVLALNKEDGGNRKFILVEQEDYANKTTAERVRRVIKGVPSAEDETLKKGLGGEFSYIKLGDAIDFKNILLGKALPSYNALATLLFSQITGQPLPKIESDKKTWFIGKNESYRVHLIYENKKAFLQSDDSYLTLKLLERMKKKLKGNQKSVIFAAGRHVDFNHLRDNDALFIYLPHEINKHFGQAK